MVFPNPSRRRGLGITVPSIRAIHNDLLPVINSQTGQPLGPISVTITPTTTPGQVSTSLSTINGPVQSGPVTSPIQQKGLIPILQPTVTAATEQIAASSSASAASADTGASVAATPAPATTTDTTDTTDTTATTSGFSAWLAGSTTILGYTISNEWLLFGGGALGLVLLMSMSGKKKK